MDFYPKNKAEVLQALRIFGRRCDLVIHTPAGGKIRIYSAYMLIATMTCLKKPLPMSGIGPGRQIGKGWNVN